MDLEEHTLDPVIEQTCAECGAKLTDAEIEASLGGWWALPVLGPRGGGDSDG